MAPRDPYAQLVDHFRQIHLLSSAASLLSWDQEVFMPPRGAEQRSRQLALLASLAHERIVDPRVADWLASTGDLDPGSPESAVVRELHRVHERETRLPAELVAEMAETESLAQNAWAEARARDDYPAFRPWLDKVLGLQRQKASCLGGGSGEPWDALADAFEPGLTAAAVQELFAPLRERLTAFVAELLEAGDPPAGELARLCVPEEAQEAFVREVVAAMGFDFEAGRLDRSTHPFCSGSGGDVRITTRFHRDNVLDALGSTMHEAGHGLYEQGLPRESWGTPLAEAVSLGIHESQSRLWENLVGRSRAFWQWAVTVARRHFGIALDPFPTESIYRDANRVERSLIRVEADEATYNLHVMVRFELELALLRGELDAADLPAAWSAKYRDHLGTDVPDDRRGCLQDIHWSCGLFGYFPTYTLGNLHAAQFFQAARRDLGDLDRAFERGDFTPLRDWLTANIHAHGQRYRAAELCRRVTGADLSPEPFLGYLEGKLREVYRL